MNESHRIIRHEVPVDDETHAIELNGDVLAVASRTSGVVEFWSVDNGGSSKRRWFTVVGTGHPFPAAGQWRGMTFDARTRDLVWHLVELFVGDAW